jgi:COP9 signalosome complex subunit 5
LRIADVDGTSHCYLSATDVGTQFSWQNQLDPWVALVIDPLRSTAKQQPDIQAFRCYPIAYTPPAGECPDGTEADEEAKQLRWGKVANRYYSLSVSHFMSQCGANLLSILSRDHQWIRMLGSSDIMEFVL